MVDDTDQLLPVPDLVMRAEEIDLPAFGLNVSNDELTAILLDKARAENSFEIVEADIVDYEFEDDARGRHSGRWTPHRGAIHHRRRRPRQPRARRRRDRHQGMDLSAGRADRAAPPRAAARQCLDRISHALRPLHAGAAAGARRGAEPLEPRLADAPARRAAAARRAARGARL